MFASATAISAVLRQCLTFNNLKSLLFFYVLATQLLRGYRHVLARGVIQSCNEGRIAISRVSHPNSAACCKYTSS